MTTHKTLPNTIKASLTLIATIFALALALRFYHLDRALGGNDENAMLLYFGYAPLKIIVTNYWDVNNHIFHSILVRLMGTWFGEENSIAIRFPTLVFGLASLWVIYLLSLDLFNSHLVARMALLIASVNPVHTFYSQTARGYSLIIFFSATSILLTLKVLRSGRLRHRGVLLTICGFFSVYTVPTNIYFLFGLAVWISAVLVMPDPKKIFFNDKKERQQKGIFFLKVFIAIIIFCFMAYFPLLGQMLETIKNHQIMTVETHWNSLSALIPGVLEKIFPGDFLIFIPLLILGLSYKNPGNQAHQSLFLIIFLLPFTITLITGMGGYPRNYLYNFPLLIILVAAGMIQTGIIFSFVIKKLGTSRWIALGICAVYCIFSVHILFQEYYPSLTTFDGKKYKEKILKHTKPNDLIAIENPENYLYARSVYQQNFSNILTENRLSGFQLIANKDFNLINYAPPPGEKIFTQVQDQINNLSSANKAVTEEININRMTNFEGVPLLPKNFETSVPWTITQGKGLVSQHNNFGSTGSSALLLRANDLEKMTAATIIPKQISLTKPSFVILIWKKKLTNQIVYNPVLTFESDTANGRKTLQPKLGLINDGINFNITERKGWFGFSHWGAHSLIGILPPGTYSIALWLRCRPKQTLIYEDFRLFLIELADRG